MTARPGDLARATVDWLDAHGVRWDVLVIRGQGDRRPSSVYKSDAVEALRRDGVEVLLALDDDRDNVAMYERHGIPALYVHSGYYENSPDLWRRRAGEAPGG